MGWGRVASDAMVAGVPLTGNRCWRCGAWTVVDGEGWLENPSGAGRDQWSSGVRDERSSQGEVESTVGLMDDWRLALMGQHLQWVMFLYTDMLAARWQSMVRWERPERESWCPPPGLGLHAESTTQQREGSQGSSQLSERHDGVDKKARRRRLQHDKRKGSALKDDSNVSQ